MQSVRISPQRRLASAVLTIPLLLMVLAAMCLPPAVAYSLIDRGLHESRFSWFAFGALAGAMWLFGLWLTIKSWRKSAAAD
jgi:hypothetical protein